MADPLFKWPGGKRWLAPRIAQLFDVSSSRIIEPFAGGAALFFHVEPYSGLLGDLNPQVINCYEQVRDNLDFLVSVLDNLVNSEEQYYKVRSWKPSNDVEDAARFLYLTRLSFNGIYRENLKGEFNVPYGHKLHLPVVDHRLLERSSSVLANATLTFTDFEVCLQDAKPGDFIYLDPPYTVAHNQNGFVKYNAEVFSWPDQRRLAEMACNLANIGCKVIVSNADHGSIQKLYPGFIHQ